jgi:hypothetical protein
MNEMIVNFMKIFSFQQKFLHLIYSLDCNAINIIIIYIISYLK